MKITATALEGVYLIKRMPIADERGYFVRMFCQKELAEAGMNAQFVQSNLSENRLPFTLRGLHSQTEQYAEEKLVSCVQGRIFDVCVDVRKDSPTFGQYVGAELSEQNGCMLYVPKGFAHGYLTLEEHSKVLYTVTQFYVPKSEKGYRYDDPAFSIDWPQKPAVISEKDRNWPYISKERAGE